MKTLSLNRSLFSYFLHTSLVIVLVLLFYGLFLNLVFSWQEDPQFSHGFLIPFISLFMIWKQRNRIMILMESETPSRHYSIPALFFVLFGLCLFIFGKYTFLLFVEGFSFIIILLASILFIYGMNIFKIAFFPVLYLLFMLPIPARVLEFFSNPLQYLVAGISAWVIGLLGAPVFLKKELIYLPSITLQVEEVCAGLRTVLAFSAIGILFAYLYIRSTRLKIIFLMLIILFAIIVNISRVSAVGIFAYFISNDAGLNIHKYGWPLISIFGFSIIFLIGWAFTCMESRKGY